MVLELQHLCADPFQLSLDRLRVVVVEVEDAHALAGALAPDLQAHHHQDAVLVGLVQDLPARASGLFGSPGAQGVGSVGGEPRDAAGPGRLTLQPGALHVEGLAVDEELIATVDLLHGHGPGALDVRGVLGLGGAGASGDQNHHRQ